MKKIYTILFVIFLFSSSIFAQTTETFEDETANSTVFTDNGVSFNITSQTGGTFAIANYATKGWNGTTADNKFIDNSNSADIGIPVEFTIKSSGSSLFKLKSIYLLLRQSDLGTGAGSCTIKGKRNGSVVFTATSASGFNNSSSTNNGYTNIDFTTYGGADNSNTIIDEYVVTTTGTFEYVALDAMRWEKVTSLITTSSSFTTFTSCSGVPSAEQSFLVSGSNLNGNITVTAPTGYEVSTTSGSNFTSNLTLLQSGGTITSMPVYVRTTSSASNNSGNIILTSPGANATLAVTNSTTLRPTISQSPTSKTICQGSNTTFSVTATGANSYQWYQDVSGVITSVTDGGSSPAFSGATTRTLSVSNVNSTMSGYKYYCAVSNNSCTVNTSAATLTVPAKIETYIEAQTNVSIYGLSNGSARISVTGGVSPYFYSWSPTGGTGREATGLSAGTYFVTITDSTPNGLGGCSATQEVKITQPPGIIVSTSSLNNFTSCEGTTPTPQNFTVNGEGLTANLLISAPSGFEVATSSGGTYGSSISLTPTSGYISTRSIFVRLSNTATGSPLGYITLSSNNIPPKTVAVTGSVTPITTIDTNPTDVSICNNSNATFTAAVSNATSYKWQIKQGVQFNDILEGGVYSGTTTTTLTVTGATSALNNTQYRLVASGNCTPSIASSEATLWISNIAAATVQTNIACNGGNTGNLTVNPTGGVGTYTYLWSNGATTSSITNLIAGDYSVTVKDAVCEKVFNFTITEFPRLIATAGTVKNVSCNGGSNGTATVNVTGGTPSYTYSWAPFGGTAATATALTAGDYTVTVKDFYGCETKQDFTITQPTDPLIATASAQTNILCRGAATGSATVSVTGGSPSYTYSWSPFVGTGATVSNLTAGTYTVTVRDANLCQTTQTFTITEPASALTASPGAITNVKCKGYSTGQATVIVTGGTGDYTYSWAPYGGTNATATGLTAGTYTVTVKDANLCQTTQSFTIIEPSSALEASFGSQNNVSCNQGANGTATVKVIGGTGAYTYSWAPYGGTNATATGLSAGTYTVTVKDANLCQTTQDFTITQPTALVASFGSQTNVSCNGGTNGSATVNVTGGTSAYTYSWAPMGGTAATASGLIAGTYTVTVTDANNCHAIQSFTITQPTILDASISKTDVLCANTATGTATVKATGGSNTYTYVWSPSGGTAATATGLATGNYSCLITDANGCSITRNILVGQPPTLDAYPSQTNATCSVGGEASVSASGGVGAYSYLWTPGGATTSTVTNLAAGNYSCRITDGNGCTITKNFTITTTNTLVASTRQTDLLCNGSSTGSASVVPSGAPGPFTYVWSPSGGNGDTATNLAAGNYSVTITAGNGCSIVKNFTITEPPAIVITKTGQTNASCFNGTNGSLSVAVTGGTGSYTYKWAPSGGTAATATGLAAGTYTVTVKDANECVKTENYIITQPAALTPSITKTDVSCNGGSNGSATVNVTGGTGAYTYSWAPFGGTAATASGLTAGNYIVTIKDANLCQTTANVLISQPDLLNATAEKTDVTCLGASDGTATINAVGGTGAYTYSWAPYGGTASTATGLAPGTYTAIITDENGCFITKTVTINTTPDVTAPIPSVAVLPEITNYCAVLASQITIPTAIDNCVGAVNGTTTDTLNYNTPGTYTITWKYDDGNGNTTMQPQTVKVLGSPINAVTFSNAEFTYDGNPHSIEVANLPTGASVSYSGNNGVVNVGTYTITATITPASTSPHCSPVVLTANLVINKASLSIIANSQTKVYGSSDPALTYVANGFVNTDDANILGGKLTRVDGENVGTYTINQGTLSANNNYNIIYTSDKLTITPKAITVIANAQTKVYGSTDPALTYAANGFENGDNTSIITGTLTRVDGENIGTYTINQGTLSANNNYNIIYTADKLTITPKAITVIANAQTKVYGSTDPTLTYVANGFENGDNTSIITGSLTRAAGENTGNYTINQGTISAGNNYIINYTSDKLTITAKTLTVIANAQTKVYNTADPVFTYTATGFTNSDTNAVITGQLSREAGENVGKYNIILGTLNSGSNYTIVFTGAEFEITKANQVITWNQVLEYGCDDSTEIVLTASSNSGLPISYTIANPQIGTIAGNDLTILNSGSTTITASQNGDQNYNAAVVVIKPIEISQAGLIVQQWADVLLFDNKSNNFVAWQWYKNGNPVSGATRQYYNENQAINGSYFVVATDKNGNSIKSCPVEITGTAFSKSLKIHPNPVRPLNEFTLECDFSESQLSGSEITIFDVSGKLVQTITNAKPQNQIIAPSQSAIYVVVLSLSNGQKKTINLLVK
ncbi:T9SS type A sorting domain-containing protein [Flavobacterium sp. 17A]|uniref:T9SS type A sorting domain-containing protein n=1 Tax=Flavobacterium potami TaxID=2872310 RepID=A0A9X1HG52_9FLAO|nr:MBG domain-containing protein [Flavobacterium potami]MBZ4037609.1 T9SS type A sorting domain-containing protein [Flavobacterium potami]